ncbi:MAG: CvpA family protein [Elusimicrobia bacterium]|nr:CvpA family protein [Elusimicrobiota bacterium]
MGLDLGLAVVVVLFGALGAFSGAIKQLAHALGLVLAYFLAKPLAAAAAPALAARLSLPPAAVKIGLSAVGFYPLYLALSLLAAVILHKLAGAQEKSPWDRQAGFAMGALKGCFLVYVPLSLALFMETKVPAEVRDSFQVPHTAVTDWTRRHNLFSSITLPQLTNMQKLMDAAKNPQAAAALLGDSKLQGMLGDPGLQSALKDDSVMKAFESGDLEALQKDPRIAALLKDPRLSGQMPDLEKALKVDSAGER